MPPIWPAWNRSCRRECTCQDSGFSKLPSRAGTLIGLAVILGVLATVVAVLGIVFVAMSEPNDASRDIGRWCLQVALVFAGTGVVSVVVRHSELSLIPAKQPDQSDYTCCDHRSVNLMAVPEPHR